MHRGIGQKVGDQYTLPLCGIFYKHYHEMWTNKAFFYDDTMLWVNVYNKLVPKIKKNIDFLLQPK